MKKICLLVFFLIFLLTLGISSAKTNLAVAQDVASPSSEKQEERSDYELPYPGLLPDSPLYFLRITRDKIVGFLISDPLKKSEFNLLQADKRLNAGIYLFNSAKQNENKMKLAVSTVSKAENYFEEALSKMQEAKMQGKEISGIERNLRNALRKHEQEIASLSERANVNFKAGFEKELKRVAGFEERLNR